MKGIFFALNTIGKQGLLLFNILERHDAAKLLIKHFRIFSSYSRLRTLQEQVFLDLIFE